MATVLLLLLCSQAIPWKPVFAFEKRLSPQPGVANEIALAWQPQAVQGETLISGDRPEFGIIVGSHNPDEDVRLLLPVLVTGLPKDSILKEDNAQMALTGADGKRLYAVDGGPIEIRREGSQSGPVAYNQAAKVPVQIYQENKDRSVRVETTYSMTLFKLNTSYSMAVGEDRLIPAWGRCESKINVAGTAVDVRCMQMGKGPT